MLKLLRLVLLILGTGLLLYSGLLETLRTEAETGIYWTWITERHARRGVEHQILLPDGTLYRTIGGAEMSVWSTDGKGLFYVEDRVLYFRPINGTARPLMDGMIDSNVYRVRFLQDGEWLIVPRRVNRELRFYRVRVDGSVQQDITPVLEPDTDIVSDSLFVHYNDQQIYFNACQGANHCRLYRMGLDGTDLEQMAVLPAPQLQMCSLAPTRRWMLYCNRFHVSNPTYYLVDTETGQVSPLLENVTQNLWLTWAEDDYLTYLDGQRGWLVRQAVDGSTREDMVNIGIGAQPLYTNNREWLYYYDSRADGFALYRAPLRGGRTEQVFTRGEIMPPIVQGWGSDSTSLIIGLRERGTLNLLIYRIYTDNRPADLMATLPDLALRSDVYLTTTPDGKAVLLNHFNGPDYLIPLDGSDYRVFLEDTSTQFNGFSPPLAVSYRPALTGGAGIGLLLCACLPTIRRRTVHAA